MGVGGEIESILDVLEERCLSIWSEAHCFELCYGANLDDLTIAGRAGARRLGQSRMRRHGEEYNADA